MPIYDIQTPSGKTLSIEAADESAAMAGAQQWHAQNSPVTTPSGRSPEADVGAGIVGGGARGLLSLAGLPGDLKKGADWANDKLRQYVADPLIETITSMKPGEMQQRRQNSPKPGETIGVSVPAPPSSADVIGAVEGVTGPLPHAETGLGKYAQTVAEFAPGGAVFGGLNSLGRAGAEVVLPALASETAGRAVGEGSPMEPIARLAGGIIPQMGVGIARARTSAPDRVIQRSTSTVTPQQWDAAEALQGTGQRVGVPLSGPEAIAEASGGETALPHLLRAVEGSTEGKTVSAPFFAARPQQVENAVGRALDTVGPQDAAPSSLGPRAATAADAAIMQTPEGQALQEAIWRAGPRTSPEEAGSVIQPALRETFDRREGMRNALADRDFATARNAPPEIPVESLEAGTFTPPNRTTLEHVPALGEYQPTGGPAVTPPAEPALSSNTGPTHIQADPRDVLNHIDTVLADGAKGGEASALREARELLFSGPGLDTSVAGLSKARTQIGESINKAVRAGDNTTAQTLQEVQRRLDATLSDVPLHAEATQGFEAASRPLDPFTNTPALERTVARDEFNRNFTTPAEQVPGAIQQGGASAARAFNEVAPRNAQDAFMNYLTTHLLDPATNAAGGVNPDRLATTVRDNVDLLRQHPEVGQRLTDIIMAEHGLAGPRAGPLGEIAGHGGGRGDLSGTRAAYDSLLPSSENRLHTGGEGELADATGRLVAASAESDPNLVPSVIRQGLQDQFNTAAKRVQSGRNQFVGAKYANEVIGTPQQEVNLPAVVEQLPGGANANRELSDLFDVLRATGQRRAEGSPTSYNQEMKTELKEYPIAVKAALTPFTLGTHVLRDARELAQRVWLGKHTGALAQMFTSPDAVQQMRAVAERQLGHPISDAMMRQLIQTPVEMNR